MNFNPLSEKEKRIARKGFDAPHSVHKTLGPGLLEKVYEVFFCHELPKRGLDCQKQVGIPDCIGVYDGIVFDEGLRSDILGEELIICELKAVDEMNPVSEAQLLSHL
jgi:GxxExxY protein